MSNSSDLAKSLVLDISQSGFEFWQDKDFRNLVSFETLSQTEQDRIFNEVLVTGLGLLALYLDNAKSEVALTEHQIYFNNLQKESLSFFIIYLKEIGVPAKFAKIWQKLIDLRLEEYREDYQTAIKESGYWKEFKGDLKLRKMWAQIETLAIDSLHHIRRGKAKTDDPLWKMIRTWLIELYKKIANQKLSYQ